MKKCMIIENPNSGDGKNDEYLDIIKKNSKKNLKKLL